MKEKDIIAVKENEALIVPDEVDNLNREEFVGNVKTIIKSLAGNRKNAAFAINGSWGVGKTWVLNRLEKDLADDYFIVRYNAWENDYYDEPLTAILSVFVDKLNEIAEDEPASKIIGRVLLSEVRETLIRAMEKLSGKVLRFNILDKIKKLKEKYEREKNRNRIDTAFDTCTPLQTAKKETAGALRKLTEKGTAIVMVDELDRCLPQYAITVLERLHHLFNGIPNLQVITAVDKDQVEKTLENIFGSEVNKTKYLQKFFDFELTLDKGVTGKNFDDKYGDYCSCFECQLPITESADVEAFKRDIFELINLEKLDGRDKDRIMEKAFVLHKMLLDKNKKYDYLYFCVEVILTMLCTIPEVRKSVFGDFKMKELEDLPISRLQCLKDKLTKINILQFGTTRVIRIGDIWSVIWKLFVQMYDVPDFDTNIKIDSMPELEDIAEYMDKVVKWLKIID